jgi:hypothetical protein
MNAAKQLGIVAGAAVAIGVLLSLYPRLGAWLLIIVVLSMVLVAGKRGLFSAHGASGTW